MNFKKGVLIAAYPGMGQDILEHETRYVKTFQLSGHEYIKTDIDYEVYNISNRKKFTPEEYKRNIENFIGYVLTYIDKETNDYVYFVDAHPDIIDELISVDYPFLIFYPGVSRKRYYDQWFSNTTVYLGSHYGRTTTHKLSDWITNYTKKINKLSSYDNAINIKLGFLSEPFIQSFRELDGINDIVQVINTLQLIKKQNDTVYYSRR